MNLPRFLVRLALATFLAEKLLAAEGNILDEGGFESVTNGMPAGFVWAGFAGDPSITPNRFSLVTEDSQFVRIKVPSATGKEVAVVKLSQPIPAPKDWVALNVSVRLRVRDYLQGDEAWHGVKAFVQFMDSEGEVIGAEVPAVSVKENVEEWTAFQKEVIIPPGTQTFALTVGFIGSSGEVDIDDLSVAPVK